MDPDAGGVELARAQGVERPEQLVAVVEQPGRQRLGLVAERGRGCGARGAASRAARPAGSAGSSAATAARTVRARSRRRHRPAPGASRPCVVPSSPVTAAITASSPVAPGSVTSRSTSRVSRSWLHSHRSRLVGDGVMDHHHVRRHIAVELDIERPGHAGHLLEAGRTQVHRQRDVGVLARVELADQLGDHTSADEHRRVGLLDAERVHVAGVLGQPASGRDDGDGRWPTASRPAAGPPAQRGGGDDAGTLGDAHGVDDGAAVLEQGDQRTGPHLLDVDRPRASDVCSSGTE